MAIAPYKTWIAGEVLTASDLNQSFLQIINAGLDLVFPASQALDLNAQELILDADADSSITADTDDQIDFRTGGSDRWSLTNTGLTAVGTTVLDLNGVELILDADADTSLTADTDDQIDVRIGGADDFRFVANSFLLLSGSNIDLDGNGLVIDGDGDSKLDATSDDIAVLTLQSFAAFKFDGSVSTPVNGLTFTATAASTSPAVTAQGSDTNLDIRAVPKGTGRLKEGTNNVVNVAGNDTLTGGFDVTPAAAGTKSSGTFTPVLKTHNFQTVTNGGAHTLAPPSGTGTMVLYYVNNASAGAITTSGFTKVKGDSFTTTSGHKFHCFISVDSTNSTSLLNVVAMQ